jgi:hypothetical protein
MFDQRSDTGRRVFRDMWVETECVLEEGTDRVVERKASYGVHCTPYALYVHPKTGLLCDARQNRTSRRKRDERTHKVTPINAIILDDQRSYELIDSIWYRKLFEVHKPNEIWKMVHFDPLRTVQAYIELRKPGDTHTIFYGDLANSRLRVEHAKFQCNKEELVWINWFLGKVRSGKITVKWIYTWDRTDKRTAAIQVLHLPVPGGRRKKQRGARLLNQGPPAQRARERVDVPKDFSEKIFGDITLPVVHRTAF